MAPTMPAATTISVETVTRRLRERERERRWTTPMLMMALASEARMAPMPATYGATLPAAASEPAEATELKRSRRDRRRR